MMIEIKSVSGRVYYVHPGAVCLICPNEEKEGVWDVLVGPAPDTIEVTESEVSKLTEHHEGGNEWMNMIMAMMPMVLGKK